MYKLKLVGIFGWGPLGVPLLYYSVTTIVFLLYRHPANVSLLTLLRRKPAACRNKALYFPSMQWGLEGMYKLTKSCTDFLVAVRERAKSFCLHVKRRICDNHTILYVVKMNKKARKECEIYLIKPRR